MIVFLTCKTEFRMQSHPDRRSFLGHSFWKVCSLLKLQINTSPIQEAAEVQSQGSLIPHVGRAATHGSSAFVLLDGFPSSCSACETELHVEAGRLRESVGVTSGRKASCIA